MGNRKNYFLFCSFDQYFLLYQDEGFCGPQHSSSDEFVATEFGINTESPVYTPHNGREEKKGSFIAALTLGIALSYHSILSGMAMGSQVTVQATLNLMYVIIAHKGLEAYALGSSLVNSHATQTKIWLLTIAYSTAMPVGILTGGC